MIINTLLKHKIKIALFVLYAIILLSYKAKADNNLATSIANKYLKSFSIEKSVADLKIEMLIEKNLHCCKRTIVLDERIKREVALSRLMGYTLQHDKLQKSMEGILNKFAWDDLKLFYGTTSSPSYNLLSRINKTITHLGEGVLAIMLVTPVSNIEIIEERQNIIKTLISHEKEMQELRNSFTKYKKSEESIFSFWTETEPLYTKEYSEYISKKFYYKNSKTNKSVASLQLNKLFFRDFWDIFSGPLSPIEYLGLGSFAIYLLSPKVHRKQSLKGFQNIIAPIFYPFWNIYHFSVTLADHRNRKGKGNQLIKAGFWDYAIPSLITAYWVWSCYSSYNKYDEYSKVLKNLALRLADLQNFLKSAQQISAVIEKSPKLEKIYGNKITELRKLITYDKTNPKSELGRLVHYLKTLPLNSWSYFFNNAGKLLASYKLFIEYKNEFRNAFYDFGQLDAFLSFATLINESVEYNPKNKYVYVKFLDRKIKPKPYIKIKGMWTPFLDAKIAIPNDLEMSADTGGVRTMILTGPNAGGKSTFITGITTSVLLAHVVGIAPVKEMCLTPFNKINTYIEILDDIAAGKSLFMAEVDRAQYHIKTLQNLKKDEFSFSIFDEPFSGTNPLEGGAAEYSILESIGKYSNALNIVATHYPIVMLLEKNAKSEGFKNYKVFIKPSTNEKGKRKINYTYKIIKGKSNQAIAIDILEAEGYDTKMLRRARDIITNPDKYKSSF